MDPKQSTYAAVMDEWDNLAPEVREAFRARELDFVNILWLQVTFLVHSSLKDRMDLYEKYYYML